MPEKDSLTVTKDSTTVIGTYFRSSEQLTKEVTVYKAYDGTVVMVVRPKEE
jgi:hypothetical protein